MRIQNQRIQTVFTTQIRKNPFPINFGLEKFHEVMEPIRARNVLEQKFGLKPFFTEILKRPNRFAEEPFSGMVAGIPFNGVAKYNPDLKDKQISVSFQKGPLCLDNAFFLTVQVDKTRKTLQIKEASNDWEEYSGYKAALILLEKGDIKLQGFRYSQQEGEAKSIMKCLASL